MRTKYGVDPSLRTVYDTLKRAELVWITGRSIHPKADLETQETFKKNFRDKVIESLPAGIAIESVDIWFQDEARVGQRGTVTRTWAAKGSRPRLTRQQQFEYAYIFGAVCPTRDEAVGLVLPIANTDAMLVHLEHISAKIPEGRHGV